jgi:hypothetical protein
MSSTHSSKLERWFGREVLENLSAATKHWYGDPIRVGNLPGRVYAAKGGDFVGAIEGGAFGSYKDYLYDRLKASGRRFYKRQLHTANSGFSSLSDAIAEATTGGKSQHLRWFKQHAGSIGAGLAGSYWRINTVGYPAASTTGAAIPTGESLTNASSGAIPFTSPSGDDTIHIASIVDHVSSGPLIHLLYDRLFQANTILHTTTGNQAISGVPTRYQSTNARNNFVSMECTVGINTTAHSVTVTYVDQDGNTAEAAPTMTVKVASSAADIILCPTGVGDWCLRLNSADSGVRYVTNVAMSAVSIGQSELFIGRPHVFLPHANSVNTYGAICNYAGLNDKFGPEKIHNSACLALMLINSTGSSTLVNGDLILVSG